MALVIISRETVLLSLSYKIWELMTAASGTEIHRDRTPATEAQKKTTNTKQTLQKWDLGNGDRGSPDMIPRLWQHCTNTYWGEIGPVLAVHDGRLWAVIGDDRAVYSRESVFKAIWGTYGVVCLKTWDQIWGRSGGGGRSRLREFGYMGTRMTYSKIYASERQT